MIVLLRLRPSAGSQQKSRYRWPLARALE